VEWTYQNCERSNNVQKLERTTKGRMSSGLWRGEAGGAQERDSRKKPKQAERPRAQKTEAVEKIVFRLIKHRRGPGVDKVARGGR